MQIPPPNGIVTLLTDFGHRDPYVGIVKGVVKQQHPGAEILDLCHGVPPQDIAVGSLFLAAAIGRFPAGTVHVAVVDPGVGTDRRLLAACAAGCYWIAPDNGLLDGVLRGGGEHELRAIDVETLRLRPAGTTFHARDLFGPAGGMLARGRYGFRALGPRVDDPVRLADPASAPPRILFADRFGNLVTSLTPAEHRRRGGGPLRLRGREVAVVERYADVGRGEPLALVDSFDLLEIAVREGRADRLFPDCGPGTAVEVAGR